MTEPVLAAAVLDQFALGVAVCDTSGRIVLSNFAATRLLEGGSPITLESGRLCGPGEIETAALRAAAARAARPGGRPRVLSVSSPDGHRPCIVVIGELQGEKGRALVLICKGGSFARRELNRLTTLWSLTAAEAALAAHIGAGRSLTEAAHRMGVAHSTAKSHLAHVFAKIEVRSQVELVRTLTLASAVR